MRVAYQFHVNKEMPRTFADLPLFARSLFDATFSIYLPAPSLFIELSCQL